MVEESGLSREGIVDAMRESGVVGTLGERGCGSMSGRELGEERKVMVARRGITERAAGGRVRKIRQHEMLSSPEVAPPARRGTVGSPRRRQTPRGAFFVAR